VSVDDASMGGTDSDLFKLIVRYWADDADVQEARQSLEEFREAAEEDRAEEPDLPAPEVEEVYDDLSPEKSASNYHVKQVNSGSVLVELGKEEGVRPSNTEYEPVWLEGTFDDEGEVDVDHYTGADPDGIDERTGLEAFKQIDEIAIVCVPDEHSDEVLTGKVVDHCYEMGDRFAILQSERDPDPIGELNPPTASDMAAFYYPWLEVRNPETGLTEAVPPGGHIAGIYARSDTQHGVHKAPANEIVRGIQGLQRTITKGEQEILNPRGVNCIRSFRGRGIRVWGARTATSDPQWKYVNVRRLFLFIEESIDEGTQWVVFESNDERLWARVKQTIRNFLTDVWQDGALMGSTPEEAFFVKCGRSTMTQNDIDNGRLICEIGVAPVKPAEFVVFRISQWTGGGE